MIPKRASLVFFLLIFLAACSMLPAPQIKETPTRSGPTPTACVCSEPGVATPTGGLKAAGPALSNAEEATPAPAGAGTTQGKGDWVTYANPTYGFSFEYPEAYTSKDYGFCSVRDSSTPPQGAIFTLALGSRTNLTLSQANQTLQEAVAAFKADPSRKDYQFEAPKERSIGGILAIVLSNRSGGTNRFSEAVLFMKNSILYRVDTGTPSACDVPALNLRELDAYSHLLDTFQFTK
jgi:hypothetical protein